MKHLDPEWLQRFADGELGRRQTRKVAAHLENCSACTETVERIRSTGDVLRLAFDEMIADAPLEDFADGVMAKLDEEERPLTWVEGIQAWFSEFFRYRRRVWVPSLALAGAATAALLVAITIGPEFPSRNLPGGTSVISVSFGSTVEGTVFELEDKDGTTTAVIWVDESKTTPSDSEARRGRSRSNLWYASKLKQKSTSTVTLAARIAYRGASGAKTT